MNTQSLITITITDKKINEELVQTIDARKLHEFLEVDSHFKDWINNRTTKYEFIENQDFILAKNLAKNISNIRGRPSKEYHITLDMAKELSMVERNAKGKEARKYFIQCERMAKQLNKPEKSKGTLTLTEQLLAMSQQLTASLQLTVDNERRMTKFENTQTHQQNQLDEIIDRQNSMDGSNGYMTVRGFDRINDVNLSHIESLKLGRMCFKICRHRNLVIRNVYDERYGSVGSYPIEVLEECLGELI